MRNEVMWNLRDAEGLGIYEYVFLTVVESRGKLYSGREKAWRDMRMGRTKFYAVRDDLIERDLLVAEERNGTTTIYTVNADVVASLVPPQTRPDLTGAQKVSKDGHWGVLPDDTGSAAW